VTDQPKKTAPLQTKYAQQYADDLTANRAEQDRITEHITSLEQRLRQLVAEEAWLVKAQSSLPGAPASSEPGPGSAAEAVVADEAAPAGVAAKGPRTVPAPRHDEPVGESVNEEQPEQPVKGAATAEPRARKAAVAKKAGAAKKAAARKPAARKPAAGKSEAGREASSKPVARATDAKKPGAPLWQLVQDILLKTPGQPLVAREVADQLVKDHPGRETTIQVVRNNLEILVRKKLAEKSLQKGSAMYTAYADAAAAADRAAEQSPETAAEKTLTKV
jgi:hypothetical protein